MQCNCKLYRERSYKRDERVKLKAVEKYTWYSDGSLKDPWRDQWKFRISRRGKNLNSGGGRRKSIGLPRGKGAIEIPTTTNMFVPSSDKATLLRRLETIEENLCAESSWKPKLVEKSGIPLVNLFRIKIPIVLGCPLGEMCKICDNDAVKCSYKGSVYRATCIDCQDECEIKQEQDNHGTCGREQYNLEACDREQYNQDEGDGEQINQKVCGRERYNQEACGREQYNQDACVREQYNQDTCVRVRYNQKIKKEVVVSKIFSLNDVVNLLVCPNSILVRARARYVCELVNTLTIWGI